MNKGNYFFLGIAASYFAIAIIQWRNSELLPISLYISLAWVSLTVTILELIKTIFQYMQAIHNRQIKITQDELDLCNRHINIMKTDDALRSEVARHMEFRPALIERAKKLSEDKSIRKIGKIVDILSIAQIVFACIAVTITSLKHIPNDLTSNKAVSILSLFAFAVLMLTYFVKGSIEPILNESDSSIRDVNMLENYYLDMLEKVVSKENSNGNNGKAL